MDWKKILENDLLPVVTAKNEESTCHNIIVNRCKLPEFTSTPSLTSFSRVGELTVIRGLSPEVRTVVRPPYLSPVVALGLNSLLSLCFQFIHLQNEKS